HRGCPRKAHRRDDRRAQERLRDRDRTRSGIGRPRAFRPRRRRVGRRANRLAERKMIDPARLAALLAACLVTVAASVPASADYLDIAQFALTEHDGGRFRLVATLSDAADTGLSPTWPRACTLRSRDASRLPNARRVAFDVDCPPASSADLRIEMPWGRDGAILELDRDDGVVESRMLPGGPTGSVIDLSERPPDAAGSSGGFWPTARRYLALGTEHVLIGWDHLAFVFCLGMLASGASLAW